MVVALGWFWTFGLTDFRAHQRIPMLAIAAATLAYALLLAVGYTWVVLSSMVVSLLVAGSAIFIQASGGFLNLFLVAVAVASLGYLIGLVLALRANRWKARD